MKLSAVRGVVEGKRVVMVDDSIVRGTTSKRIVQMLKEAGAKEVMCGSVHRRLKILVFMELIHLQPEELIASENSVEEIREMMAQIRLHF